MLILSNSLLDITDEGALKVARSLVKRIKNISPETEVITYERESTLADHHLQLNKLLLNRNLISLLRKNKKAFLYIPFPAKSISIAIRIFTLSLFSKQKVNAALVMKSDYGFIAKTLLKISNANLIVFSKASYDFYSSLISKKRIAYLKTGVDTQKFSPVSPQKASELKQKYGFDPSLPLVLHVGHLKQGRNLQELLKLDSKYQILIVTSTQFPQEQDNELKKLLLSRENLRIFTEYIPNIEEMYQMSDVYFFPVTASGNCIDVPLSCMEAASCNKPVVTTAYGEMEELLGVPGIYHLSSLDFESINSAVSKAVSAKDASPREHIINYDWNNAIDFLIKL